MSEGPNPLMGIAGFWMLIQLVSTLALVLGGIYALYCLTRTTNAIERLADATERLTTPDVQTQVAPTNTQGHRAGNPVGQPTPCPTDCSTSPTNTPATVSAPRHAIPKAQPFVPSSPPPVATPVSAAASDETNRDVRVNDD